MIFHKFKIIGEKFNVMKVKIGKKNVGPGEPCFISLEPSATYSNLEEAKKMISAVSLAGADAIKFQTFITGDSDRIMGEKNITVDFTTTSGKKQELVYDALKRRELSKEEWKELASYTKKLNLLFITAPYFLETVDFLEEIGVDAIKISKGDINNVFLIEKIAKTGLPIILDTREKFDDMQTAIKICEQQNNNQLIIMHCPSGYPTKNSGVHLNAIKTLRRKFDYPIAFADHSPGDMMNYAAVSLGVSMLEKTITADKSTEHVEHFMSLEIKELKKFVENIRSLEEAMGDPDILKISRVEESARRSLVSKRDIKKGEVILVNLLDFKRPGNLGISCSKGFSVINKKASRDIPKNTFLQWDMLE